MAKINLFEDKEYDKLDWLNKAVEPFIFPPNDVLAAMPEVVTFDFATIWSLCNEGRQLNLSMDRLVDYAASLEKIDMGHACLLVKEHYKLEVDPDTVINLEEKSMTGGVRIIKTKNQLNDEDIASLLSIKLYEKLRYINYENQYLQRLNEVLDLIGAKETRGSRSARNKLGEIADTMKKVVLEDKWRVRNYDLMLSTGDWLKKYIEDGNLAAMSNFTRLKCMTHKGIPIYSMEETK